MKLKLNLNIFILLSSMGIFIVSCAPKKNKTTSYPTVQEILEENGEPDSIKLSEIDEKSQMYKYGKSSYQIKEGFALMKFRAPKTSEKSIQFWRHKFEGQNYKIIEYSKTEHTTQYKLVHKKEGLEVLFSETGIVERVAIDQGVKHE